MSRITPALKWHGSKSYLADKLWALMPPHTHRVHPFGGAWNEAWNWPHEGYSEVYNDVDGNLTNFFRVLQNPEQFEAFRRIVEATPFSQAEWDAADDYFQQDGVKHADPAFEAAAFFVWVRQSMSGRCKSFSPLSRTRTRRGMNEQASSWLTAVEGLLPVHQRLLRVAVLHDEAVKVIQSQDGPQTLHYCDPPYLPKTRTAKKVYAHEMTVEQHQELLTTLLQCKGRVMLSGYDNELYNDMLVGWKKHCFELPNNAASGETKRRMTEVVWTNF